MARKFDAESHIVDLNSLRIQLANIAFTSDTLREGFKNCNIPSNPIFLNEFFKSGLITQIGKDLYCFTNPSKPIHFNKLNDIYKEYKKKSDKYHNKWYNKEKRKNVLKRSDIQAAIRLLNENGMEVIFRICLD